jgi:O-antigen/teichoic acid export membrane protein
MTADEPGSLRPFLRSVPSVVLLTAASSAFAAGFAVLSARDLGPAPRGGLVVIATTASLTSLFATLGFNTTGRYLLGTGPDRVPRVSLSGYLRLSYALSAACAVLLAAAGPVALPALGVSATVGHVLVLAAMGGALLLALAVVDALHALGQHVQGAGSATFGAGLGLVLAVVLGRSDQAGITAYATALTSSSLATFVVARAALASHAGPAAEAPSRSEEWRLLLRNGLSTLGVTFGQAVTFRVDRLVVAAMLPPRAVGVYAVATTVPELLRLVPYAASQVAFRQASAGTLRTSRQLSRLRGAVVLVVGLAGAVIFVAAPGILSTVFGSEFAGATEPMRILLLGELAIASYYVDSRILSGLGGHARAGRLSWCAFAATIALDLLLIPPYGITGAAVASVLTYGLLAAATGWAAVARLTRSSEQASP